MAFTQHKYLNLNCADSGGKRPNREMIGKRYFHSKSQRVYRVDGFVWNSSTDLWDVQYSRSGCDVTFTRVIGEFLDGRFLLIRDDAGGLDEED